jgi:hypothetical protein
MKITLNNRHKAGLFLTTVVAGLCLILGETVRETIGAIIIGCALTWAFGSTSKMLRISIGAIGFLILSVPFFAALIDHHDAVKSYEKSLESFRSKLPDFSKTHPDLTAGLPPPPSGYTLDCPSPTYNPLSGVGAPVPSGPPPGVVLGPPVPDPYAAYGGHIATSVRTLTVPIIGDVSFSCSMSSKDIAKALRAYPEKNRAPNWYLEALDAGVSPDAIDQLTPPLDKPESFDIKHAISDGAVIEVPSAILVILFFGSVIAETKRFTSRSNKPVEL